MLSFFFIFFSLLLLLMFPPLSFLFSSHAGSQENDKTRISTHTHTHTHTHTLVPHHFLFLFSLFSFFFPTVEITDAKKKAVVCTQRECGEVHNYFFAFHGGTVLLKPVVHLSVVPHQRQR